MIKSVNYILAILFLLINLNTEAQLKPAGLFRDNMVLQRDEPINIWGWTGPGEAVQLQFRSNEYSVSADRDGNWNIKLPPQNAGGPYSMAIISKDTVFIKNIMIGDVWLCAGQSNMQHTLELHKDFYELEIREADYPEIRHVRVPFSTSLTGPLSDIRETEWKQASPQNLNKFSAVAYFFGLKI